MSNERLQRIETSERDFIRGWNAYVDGRDYLDQPTEVREGFRAAVREHEESGQRPSRKAMPS